MKRSLLIISVVAVALTALFFVRATRHASRPDEARASETKLEKRRWSAFARDMRALDNGMPPSISGRVQTWAGEPIAGASVCAVCGSCDLMNSPAPVPKSCTQSNALGLYELADLPLGAYRLSAAAPGFRPGIFHDGAPIELGTEDLTSQHIVLEAGGAEVSGIVVDATGGVVVGASVLAYFGKDWMVPRHAIAQQTRTDEKGEFRLWLPEGSVGVGAAADGYAGTRMMVFAPARDIRMVLTPDAQISGTVSSTPGGEPAADVVVTAQAEAWEGRATTDSSGAFTIKGLRPGIYELDGVGAGWIGRRSGTVTLDLGEEITGVDFALTRGVRVAGSIRVGEEPCDAGQVHLQPAPGEPAPPLFTSTAASGEFEFEAVPPGRYRPTIMCRDYEPKVEPWIDVAAEDVTGLSWRFENGVELRVRTQTPEGKAVAGAWVILKHAAGSKSESGEPLFPRQVQSDEAGLAKLTGVAGGKYVLESALVKGTPLSVDQRSGVQEVTLTVLPMGSIEVIVRDQHGRPNDNVGVSAEPLEKGGNHMAEFGSARGDGRYRIGPLVAGAYRVDVRDHVNPRKSTDESQSISVRSGEATLVHVTYGGHSGQITGRIVDGTGSPVANVWVGAIPSSQEQDRYLERVILDRETRCLSNPEGQFSLEELAADGSFTLIASHSLGGRARLENVKVGQRVELLLSTPGSVSGTVRNSAGEPPAYFTVTVLSAEQDQNLSPRFGPDAKGRWRVDHVAPGPLEVSAFSSDGAARLSQVLAPGAQLSGVELQLAPTQIAQNSP